MQNILSLKYSTLLICIIASLNGLAEETSTSFFSPKTKLNESGTEAYSSNLDLKRHKKIGAGLAIGGTSGQLGVQAELNLDPEKALVIGLGTGPSYGTISLIGKYNFEALYVSPYFKGGYSKWFSAGKTPSDATSSDVLRQIYSQSDLQGGRFDANFLVGSIGAEYNQLEGEWVGVNFFGEVSLLAELRTARLVPTGSVGLTFFY